MLQTVLCGAACAAAAYLLGSLSFSIIVTRLLYHKDIRTFGSGNAGMTNVLRTFGKGAAALTIVGDIGKGILAVLLAKWAFGAFTAADPIYGAYIAAFCAVLGHVYPVYFGFKGGKAVSVATGTIIAIKPGAYFAFVGGVFYRVPVQQNGFSGKHLLRGGVSRRYISVLSFCGWARRRAYHLLRGGHRRIGYMAAPEQYPAH